MVAAMGALSEQFDIETAALPLRGRDAELLRAEQFESLAGWLERLAGAFAAPPVVTDYAAMTKAELSALADERGITYTSRTTKDELTDALLASDGVSEDAQAALDEGSG